ncbi:MAG: DUF979 domain-containing protein [Gemmatimonadaceae bacterium]
MIRLEFVYVLMGLLVGGVAIANLLDRSHPKRVGNALFWGLWSVSFLAGSHLPDLANGFLVLLMVGVAAVRALGGGTKESSTPEERRAATTRLGNRLFVPALLVPALTLIGTFTLAHLTLGGSPLVDPKQVTLISLGLATLIALVVALVMLRPPLTAPVGEARRLLDTVGWAAVLPQSLAALGAVFAAAGVGKAVSTVVTAWIPLDQAVVAVVTYTVGMALLTIVMGNTFAVFPIMTAGVGLPLIVGKFGGDPVIMSAIGMLSGYCGTLMTPMAANYNIVPAALLELPDQYGVIRVQIPTGILLLLINTVLMATFVYHP